MNLQEKLSEVAKLADEIHQELLKSWREKPHALGRTNMPDCLLAAQIKHNADYLLKWHGGKEWTEK